ncbi:GNAT family N-acetyltransferase [Streptomyces sp. NPDC054841]
MIEIRAVGAADAGAGDRAPALAEAFARNREYMRPWEPRRAESFYTATAQAARLADPRAYRWHLFDGDRGDRIVGEATLSGVALGPFRSAHLGYWVDGEYTGRGLATRLAEEVCRAAREELGLHRVEAATLLGNAASQRVLAKARFEVIGIAARYLHIDGEWRDHRLFQRILHDDPPPV